ncbi:MAG: glucose 1-dehydrogenase [Geminicoccaceae bacterium]|nr:glucose 1-dehydrogenase [Geminicoccaceae bacterium]MCX7629590.1 glucose 1-dehydrogenase [Geminicoccaceae bacterium]MDW8125161.1 glucose 1-dehydrogenase [Geminicoccaceae bacterium]
MSLSADLSGKVALVTGASSGLGLHMARTLARAGAAVALAARRLERIEAEARALRAEGRRAVAVPLDVTDPRSVEEGLARARAALGTVTVLVNNAGIAHTDRALELPPATFRSVLATNLEGAFLVAQAAARAMIEAKVGGSIVNVASILGFRVAGRVAAYAASKAGLVRLTEALALEWARFGIRVNALAPGYIETDLNREFFASEAGKAMIARVPQRRLGRMEDLDGPLLLLASDASAYMTGTTIVVDGGHLVSSL